MAKGLGKMHKRCLISFLAIGGAFLFLVGKIGYWQFVKGEELKDKATAQHITAIIGNIPF